MLLLIVAQRDQSLSPIEIAIGQQPPAILRANEDVEVGKIVGRVTQRIGGIEAEREDDRITLARVNACGCPILPVFWEGWDRQTPPASSSANGYSGRMCRSPMLYFAFSAKMKKTSGKSNIKQQVAGRAAASPDANAQLATRAAPIEQSAT